MSSDLFSVLSLMSSAFTEFLHCNYWIRYVPIWLLLEIVLLLRNINQGQEKSMAMRAGNTTMVSISCWYSTQRGFHCGRDHLSWSTLALFAKYYNILPFWVLIYKNRPLTSIKKVDKVIHCLNLSWVYTCNILKKLYILLIDFHWFIGVASAFFRSL